MQLAPFELDINFDKGSQDTVGVRIYSDEQHWTEIAFDIRKGEFYVDRTRSGLQVSPDFPAKTSAPLAPGRLLDVRVVVDRSSVEAFAQNGTIAMSNLIYPISADNRLEFFSSNSKPPDFNARIWKLRSIWNSH